jgi:hypothetical protein
MNTPITYATGEVSTDMRSIAADKATDLVLQLLSPVIAAGCFLAYVVMAATMKLVPSQPAFAPAKKA